MQLGCTFTDINITPYNKREDSYRSYIDITKTAISNLEKGTTQNKPELFDRESTSRLIEKTIELSREKEISSEVLEKKLKITPARASALITQLNKAKALAKPRWKIIN